MNFSKIKCIGVILCVLLSLILMLTFVSCEGSTNNPQDSQSSPTTSVGEETTEPTPDQTSSEGSETQSQITDETMAESGSDETEAETEPFKEIERVVEQRYFVFKVWNFGERKQADFEAIVDAVVETGCNAIKIHVPWGKMEPDKGIYRFDYFDAMIDYVVNTKGLSVVLAIDISRDINDTILSNDDFMRTSDGFISVGGGNNTWAQISFSSETAMNAAVEYYENCISHFHARYGDKVLFYQATFSQYAETEYWPAGELDYSLNAVKAFRAFLEEKYGTIEKLNEVLGTSYISFKIVDPPAPDAVDGLGVLWYQFRHAQLKSAIDRLASVQKAIAPDSKIGVQFGSVFDYANDTRGTAAFASLCENVDVVFVDDAPTYNHRWSMDYIRNMLPAHAQYGNDIDAPTQNGATPDVYKAQCMESYEHGATYITLSNWQIDDDYYEYEDTWKEVIATWCTEDAPKTIQKKDNVVVMEVSLYQMFCCKSFQCFQYYQQEYERLTADGNTTVLVNVVDDLTTREIEKYQAVYSLRHDFEKTNAVGSPWNFFSYKRGEPIPMIYDTDRWKDESKTPFFTQTTFNCGTRDAGVQFTAPESGKITYTAVIAKHDANGDGANIWLLHNGVEIYPTVTLDAGILFISFDLTVAEGDTLLLMFDKNQDAGSDVFYFDIRVDYK